MFKKVCIIVLLAIGIVTLSAESISVNQFKVINTQTFWKEGQLHVQYEIRNNSSSDQGLLIEIIEQDKEGCLVMSKKFWPKQRDNIPAKASILLEVPIMTDEHIISTKLLLVDAKQW